MKYFMLDIETMGTDPESDDIIQIGVLELTQNADGTYRAGRSFEKTLYTAQVPKNDFIKNTHAALLSVSRQMKLQCPPLVRNEITAFFKECGVDGPAMLMGLNATGFDVPFMTAKGYLVKPYHDHNNKLQGDYHYRVYELKGAYNLAQDVLNLDSKSLFERANAAATDTPMPLGKPHEALYDCFSQLKVLNGVIRLLKRKVA